MKKNKESFGQAFTKACGVRGEALPQTNDTCFIRIALAGQAFFFLSRKKNQKRDDFPHFHPMQPEVAKF